MGNCCPKDAPTTTGAVRSSGQPIQAFQGQGHKLGTIHDNSSATTSYQHATAKQDDLPAPAVDHTLTDEERLRIRAERAAAAEARLQKNGDPKKKKSSKSSSPLRGPNSEPLMRWTAG